MVTSGILLPSGDLAASALAAGHHTVELIAAAQTTKPMIQLQVRQFDTAVSLWGLH